MTSAEFKAFADITTTNHDAQVTASITAASRAVDGWCGRTFTPSSSTSSRVFKATHDWFLDVDDFGSTTGLTVATDESDTGTYGTTWTVTTDFTVEPANLLFEGLPWAYNCLRSTGNRTFPCTGQRNRVQVTAAWGWPAVPDAVFEATKELALDIFKAKDTPFGVAGMAEYGVVRVRENKTVQMLLMPYRRTALRI